MLKRNLLNFTKFTRRGNSSSTLHFKYTDLFQLTKDATPYRKLSNDFVKSTEVMIQYCIIRFSLHLLKYILKDWR